MQSRSGPKLANLQDFAVFKRVSRAFKGIRPTGKGSKPLPVIDFKRNLQNQGLVWVRNGYLGALLSTRPNPLVGRFAQREERRQEFSPMFSMTGRVLVHHCRSPPMCRPEPHAPLDKSAHLRLCHAQKKE